MNLSTKDIFGLLSILVLVPQYWIYLTATWRGEIRPHIFSFTIWMLGSGIIAVSQYYEKGGPGAWGSAGSTVLCLFTMLLTYRLGTKYITRSDWVAFTGALAAIPLWIVTKDPFWSVVLITVIEVIAYFPTFRKAWMEGREELPAFWICAVLQYTFIFLALETYNWTTILNPGFNAIACGGVVLILLVRCLKQVKEPLP